MKKILYLTFYFYPDLCAGSFRNTPLVDRLAKKTFGKAEIEVITTIPNRYESFKVNADKYEVKGNLVIHRIELPRHKGGMIDQILSFKEYYNQVTRIIKGKNYDLVIASSSRLFTAFLGYKVASSRNLPLYLDIRDIFYDTIEDVLKNPLIKSVLLPLIKRIEKKTFSYATHINLISGGFKSYFEQYEKSKYSYFSNGIDSIFMENNTSLDASYGTTKKIVYAGNMGEGQGLDKILPEAAKLLGNEYQFLVIGDGGTKERLVQEIKSLKLTNIEFLSPVKRDELIKIYENCDYTFVHLNDYKAFKKVLPSKIFELACFPQPIIAGVGGFARQFVSQNINNVILFNPGDAKSLVSQLKTFEYRRERRTSFIEKHRRSVINERMVETMIKYL